MARAIQVIENLRNDELASACLAQRDERQGIDLHARDVLGDLVLPLVAFEIGEVHATQVEVQLLAAQEPFPGAVPIARLDERGVRLAEFELEAAFGAPGNLERKLVGAEIELDELVAH